MRYAAALVLLVFAAGGVGAATDPGVDCSFAYVEKDYETAVAVCTAAAEQGDLTAQITIAGMYDFGDGVPQDYAKAAEWFTKAAEQGYAMAQGALGVIYYLGEGVPKDYVRAFMWLNLAAPQGDEEVAKAKDTLRKRMTPEQIAEAQRLSSKWFEKFKATEDGD